jgi:hypothetical protein
MRDVTGTLRSRALVWSCAMPRFTGGLLTDRRRRHHGHERRRLITGDVSEGRCVPPCTTRMDAAARYRADAPPASWLSLHCAVLWVARLCHKS